MAVELDVSECAFRYEELCTELNSLFLAVYLQSDSHSNLFPYIQIAREAEAAMFHRQMFEELRRLSHLTRDPTESVAIGAVEASFKCCASAIIVLTKTGR